MCGRFVVKTPVEELGRIFGFPERPNLGPRYNVAPTQDVGVVVNGTRPETAGRHLVQMRWGLVPPWAEDVSIGNRLINARAEGIADKPSFRHAVRQRRCLVPADGFYEWKAEAKAKLPYLIRRRDERPFAFAGLWERWRGPKAGPPLPRPLLSATIVTTEANSVLQPLHARMPVILDPSAYDAWLDPGTPVEAALDLLRPCPDDWLEPVAVSTRVNNVRNDDEACLTPLVDARNPA
ncbi:MAG TPA: SOS response-associated peptidase [Azospirillaceae bacterium]|nr:SOS response-associated peptidase [Azospirillaceae bacterium]